MRPRTVLLLALPLAAGVLAAREGPGWLRVRGLPPVAAGSVRHFAGGRGEGYAFDLPESYRATKGELAGVEFACPRGGHVRVLWRPGSDPEARPLIEEALDPPNIGPARRRRVEFARLEEGGRRGFYRDLTMNPGLRGRENRTILASLSDGESLHHVDFTLRSEGPVPSREEILAILRSIRSVR